MRDNENTVGNRTPQLDDSMMTGPCSSELISVQSFPFSSYTDSDKWYCKSNIEEALKCNSESFSECKQPYCPCLQSKYVHSNEKPQRGNKIENPESCLDCGCKVCRCSTTSTIGPCSVLKESSEMMASKTRLKPTCSVCEEYHCRCYENSLRNRERNNG